MTANPYQPPSLRAAVTDDDPAKQPWYETKPADWERTAAVCWVAAVALLIIVGWNPVPPQVTEASGILRMIPGPEVIGGLGYVGLTLVLATAPAAFCALLHYAAMGASKHPLYRKVLVWGAICGGLVLTSILCVSTQWLMIR